MIGVEVIVGAVGPSGRRSAAAALLSTTLGPVDVLHRCLHCGSTDHGVPFIPGASESISVSYSGDVVVVAVSDRRVGVDIERLVPGVVNYWEGALSPEEVSAVSLRPRECRELDFLTLWTAKEAVVKALGFGLHVEPSAVSLPGLLTGEPTEYDVGLVPTRDPTLVCHVATIG